MEVERHGAARQVVGERSGKAGWPGGDWKSRAIRVAEWQDGWGRQGTDAMGKVWQGRPGVAW
jgi:hypothetical protein